MDNKILNEKCGAVFDAAVATIRAIRDLERVEKELGMDPGSDMKDMTEDATSVAEAVLTRYMGQDVDPDDETAMRELCDKMAKVIEDRVNFGIAV